MFMLMVRVSQIVDVDVLMLSVRVLMMMERVSKTGRWGE